MSAERTSGRRITDRDLLELVPLIEGSDSVELKLTVADTDQRSTVVALGMDPLAAEIRQVYFLDTPELALSARGVVVRVRRIRKGDDTVVKLRPLRVEDLDPLRSLPGFTVEVDAMPGGFVCSGSMKGDAGGDVREVVGGHRRPATLFSKRQRALYAEHAPPGLELDHLTLLGPILVLKLKFSPDELARRLVAEMWLYPDNSRILELSTKCGPEDAFQVAAELRAFLVSKGVDLDAEQETKTRRALEYFAGSPKSAARL